MYLKKIILYSKLNDKLKTQEYLNEIEAWTNRKKMVLNEKKTKCMVFNRSKRFQFTTDIQLKDKKLDIVDETKLLGVIITNDLRWNKNTESLVKNANAKMRMLQVASKFIKNKNDLLHIYKTFIRSRLEFASVVWHSGLTRTNEKDLERVQKSALKLILKEAYSDYSSALKLLDVESLVERRKKLSLKFAKKCLQNENFKRLFPLRKNSHVMDKRKTEKFLIKNCNTESYKKSAIPLMLTLMVRGGHIVPALFSDACCQALS